MFDLAIYVMYERAIVLSESLKLINKFVVIKNYFSYFFGQSRHILYMY